MPNQPNIIFLMLDTVRADVFSTYDGKRRMKNLDSLAEKSLVFENAIAPATYTLPSHLAIFLGKRPRAIKELRKDNMKHYDDRTDPFMKKTSYIKGNEMTLAKHLSYLGYETALFSNNPFITAAAGVCDGFSYVENMFVEDKINNGSAFVKVLLRMIQYDIIRNNVLRLSAACAHIFPDESFDSVYLRLRKKVDRHFAEECNYYSIDIGAQRTNRSISKYFGTRKKGGNFIFVNYMEGHEGYPTNLITDRRIVQDKWLYMIGHSKMEDADAERMAYLKRVEYLDRKISDLLKALKKKGALENAYVIITADHGQGFMEHGQMYHNVFPYNEIVKVPLIISKFEKGRQVDVGKRIGKPVSLTILNKIIPEMVYGNINNIEKAAGDFAVSDHLGITEVWDTYLLKLIKHRSKSADAIYRKKRHYNKFASAIFYKNYKLIHYYGTMKDEMYRTDIDPEEKNNIVGRNSALARKMVRFNSTTA